MLPSHELDRNAPGIVSLEQHAVRVTVPELSEKLVDLPEPEQAAVSENSHTVGQRLHLVQHVR